MKVVIAPDSFKECLSAVEVASALAAGVVETSSQWSVDLCPLGDGGEGTVSALVAATGGRFVDVDVYGPLGNTVRARFGLLGRPAGATLPGEVGLSAAVSQAEGGSAAEGAGSQVAVIEMASASGLALVPMEHRDPLQTTTFGTGQLILAALDAGARELIIGIGGSATVDGGCGCAQALGVVFIGRDGKPCVCGLAGGGLADVESIDLTGRDGRVAMARIRVACDVTNPLTGPDGAARVYGPQKGATEEMVEVLEAGLAHLAEVILRATGQDVQQMPGAGAAGGLGAGLVAFAGAMLEPGLPLIAGAVGLSKRLEGADLCITGEGRLDRSSSFGKTAVGVAKIASEAGVPVICVPGQADDDAPRGLFAAVHPLTAGDVTVRQAMKQAEALLKMRAAQAVREFFRR
ncbi:MAG TPA: glycerate kinase [Phycisphaerae bacterium]|nr:glycerate kinase [Phycisphaerae bacterium]